MQAPAGARVIDGTGKFLIPGMIDAHIHLRGGRGGGQAARPSRSAKACARCTAISMRA